MRVDRKRVRKSEKLKSIGKYDQLKIKTKEIYFRKKSGGVWVMQEQHIGWTLIELNKTKVFW